ncbi:hypothetical protein RF11_12175 [Thelohanellus kitauei]|uniref:Uncharacterized protein n=1 Tax=Thelohanellus kitauei TaxID=669202 RepID=A0A0C2M7J7_THEKT|nr:hypothetical protein RF11_12175 [Thelohanellus kitauei]
MIESDPVINLKFVCIKTNNCEEAAFPRLSIDFSMCRLDSIPNAVRSFVESIPSNPHELVFGDLIKSLQKKLRIGLAEQSMLVALAHAFVAHESSLDCVPTKEELEIATLTRRNTPKNIEVGYTYIINLLRYLPGDQHIVFIIDETGFHTLCHKQTAKGGFESRIDTCQDPFKDGI